MRAKSIELVWMVVKDFEKAVKFYTEVAGLKLIEKNEEWGWAELEGFDGGAKLGIARQGLKADEPIKPGQNTVLTFTVDNIEMATKNVLKQGGELIGKIEIVPDHVKLQTVRDKEGNIFQIVEKIPQNNTAHKHTSCCSC